MSTFTIKRGDTSPALRYALEPNNIPLAGASVRFQMRPLRGETVIDAVAAIVTDSPPVVEYAWQAGDTEAMGRYEAEFRVQYADGAVETFPNEGFIAVSINRDVPDIE